MTDHIHEETPPCGKPPPALFYTSTKRNQSLLRHSFTNLTSNPSSPTVSPLFRPISSNLFLPSAKPWHCAECPAVSTPLRRRGPQGRKTLCNACGIKYGKRRKEAKQTTQTDINTNQILRDLIKRPLEDEAAARQCGGGASKGSKRRKLDRPSEGKCTNPHLSFAVNPEVSQQETGCSSEFFNRGIGMSFAVKAAVPQDLKKLTMTEDATTRGEHSTESHMAAQEVLMRTEPSITSPLMPGLFSHTMEAFPSHLNMVDESKCVNASAFFAPAGSSGIKFETGDHETESTITREEVESKMLAGMPSPASMCQVTTTKQEGEPIQARLQYVDDGTICLHTDQNFNSNEEIATAREMNSANLGCSQRSMSQATELMSLVGGSNGWCDNFARGYGGTVPTTTQENVQTRDTKHEDMTSVGRRVDGKEKEGLVKRCMGTVWKLREMSKRVSKDVDRLGERITRFAKKNEELEVARQRNHAVIERLTSEKTMAYAKLKLLWDDIAEGYRLLEHLRR